MENGRRKCYAQNFNHIYPNLPLDPKCHLDPNYDWNVPFEPLDPIDPLEFRLFDPLRQLRPL